MADRGARVTWGSLVIIALLIVLATGILIRLFHGSRSASRVTGCASHLRLLWQAQFDYAARHGSPSQIMPTHVGKDFILKLQLGPDPVLARHDVFFCPVSGEEVYSNRTSYRGPRTNVNKLEDTDPVLADKEGNHGRGEGGNVLTKIGDVREYAETDALWIRARVTTRD